MCPHHPLPTIHFCLSQVISKSIATTKQPASNCIKKTIHLKRPLRCIPNTISHKTTCLGVRKTPQTNPNMEVNYCVSFLIIRSFHLLIINIYYKNSGTFLLSTMNTSNLLLSIIVLSSESLFSPLPCVVVCVLCLFIYCLCRFMFVVLLLQFNPGLPEGQQMGNFFIHFRVVIFLHSKPASQFPPAECGSGPGLLHLRL